MHNELLKPWWWLVEFVPKLHYNSAKRRNGIRLNLFRSRRLLAGELLHEAALRRIHDDPSYNPVPLSRAFVEQVRAEGDPEVARVREGAERRRTRRAASVAGAVTIRIGRTRLHGA